MKIIKWQNIVQLQLYYQHKSKWEFYALKELYDSKEEAENAYIRCVQTKYIGACKLEIEIPDEELKKD